MKDKCFTRYWLWSCIGVLLASFYPLTMGVRVIADMLRDGLVYQGNYPKYIIPYTPIAVAVILGVALMPLFFKWLNKYALLGGAALSAAVFFAVELLLEKQVVVGEIDRLAELEDWQMYMCYISPNSLSVKVHSALEILTGEYNAAFKLHFYAISLILIVTLLNSFYGFGQMLRTGETKRRKALILQSVCTLLFLGLCILACFTAFWRDGGVRVSPLSATLMTVFFVLFGMTFGIGVGSFLLGKRRCVSVLIPAATASALTLLMYIGEMILLTGGLYRFGNGWLFAALPLIVLSPFDLLTVAAAGGITALIFVLLNKRSA